MPGNCPSLKGYRAELTQKQTNERVACGDFCISHTLVAFCLCGLSQIQEKELQQNRMRIAGIYRYVEYLEKQLEEFK